MTEGIQTISEHTPATPGISAVAEPPAPKAATRKKRSKASDEDAADDEPEGIPGAVVGLPVQFCTRTGEVVPAVLQRQSRSDPSKWDVRYSLNGASVMPTRSDVAFSAELKPGHWRFLPGFEPK